MKDPFKTARPRSIFMAAGLFLCLAILAPATFGQDEPIRVATDLVTIPLSVIDREGRYVGSLKPKDFRIFENGEEQEVVHFTAAEEPVTVLILLDRSGSMGLYFGQMANAASVFVKQLRPNDQLLAATFADDVDELFGITKVSEAPKAVKLRNRPGDHTTMIYDAVQYALKKVKKIRGRKAVLLFSDGAGDGVFTTAKKNLREAEESEALIYTVQFDTFPKTVPRYRGSGLSEKVWRESIEEANAYMRDLARVTGGRAYKIENISSLEETFRSVADELNSQYTLGYYPHKVGNDGERRKITVKVNVPNVAVRSRNEVIYKKSKK